jgi:hypothetical protein
MPLPYNPYAPPGEATTSPPYRDDRVGEACWREGGDLFVGRPGALPARCIRCNAPAVAPRKMRTLYWHNPPWYLLILLNLIL